MLVNGAPPRLGNHELGYVPQQQAFDRSLPIRARDLVRFGVDGHHWGLPRRARAIRQRVDEALDAVGASAYADAPVGLLSGGEQQRLRIAQALLGDPKVLLCDEPLLALDLASQRAVTRLIDERRRQAGTPVVFVTHEVNPVLPYVDRILYLVRGSGPSALRPRSSPASASATSTASRSTWSRCATATSSSAPRTSCRPSPVPTPPRSHGHAH